MLKMNLVDIVPVIFVVGTFTFILGYTVLEFAKSKFD
tara:strand:+ start:1605 stop:1715 length:111 start_codon:yes stop_codon:yes gene_type:complete